MLVTAHTTRPARHIVLALCDPVTLLETALTHCLLSLRLRLLFVLQPCTETPALHAFFQGKGRDVHKHKTPSRQKVCELSISVSGGFLNQL